MECTSIIDHESSTISRIRDHMQLNFNAIYVNYLAASFMGKNISFDGSFSLFHSIKSYDLLVFDIDEAITPAHIDYLRVAQAHARVCLIVGETDEFYRSFQQYYLYGDDFILPTTNDVELKLRIRQLLMRSVCSS